jgi:serine/threonine protein kinase
MAAEISVDSFLDLLRQSGLVSDNQVLSLMAEFSGEGAKQQTAREVADELVKRGLLTEWQADNLLQGKCRGFFLGPHRILRQLGQGGMSKVFLAEHELMRRRCAIKILPSKHQADPELLRRFRVEAMAIAALDHPHIVRAYDFNRDVKYGKDIDYLVMEYVEGQDLRRMVEELGPLDYRKAADYMCQAAEGLAHAHAAGLVHRDIKPANLLVDPNGVLKILDLGLARITFEGDDGWQNAEGEQSAVGTADYVAPEQVMDSRSADGRADIYSLGYTFYFLLTGRRPFPKSTLPELLMAHRVENPEPIPKLRPDVPLELVAIIDQMTAKTPEMRFQTAKEVADALQTWLRDASSNREYSRISALMAAAMRAKQSGPEDAPTKPEPAKNADLELAFIDDDATAPSPPANQRSEPRKSPEAKDKPRRPGPGDSGRTPTVSKTQADLLLDLVADQRLSQQVTLPSSQYKRHSGMGDLMSSPWLWIGLAGVLFVVLILLAILFGSSPPKAKEHSLRGAIEEKSGSPSAPAPAPKEGTPESKGPIASPESGKSPASSVKVPPPMHREEQPPRAAPVEKKTPPPELPPPKAKDEPAPPPQAKDAPPEKKAAEVDKTALLAGVTTITFKFTSADAELNAQLGQYIRIRAIDAAKQTRMTLDEKSSNVMNIEVKTATEADPVVITVSVQLMCQDGKGGQVCVWSESKQGPYPRRMRPEPGLQAKVGRPVANKLFEQFIKDVRGARTVERPQ